RNVCTIVSVAVHDQPIRFGGQGQILKVDGAQIVRGQDEGELVRLGDGDRESLRDQTIYQHRKANGSRRALFCRVEAPAMFLRIAFGWFASVEGELEVDAGEAAAIGRGYLDRERSIGIALRLAGAENRRLRFWHGGEVNGLAIARPAALRLLVESPVSERIFEATVRIEDEIGGGVVHADEAVVTCRRRGRHGSCSEQEG